MERVRSALERRAVPHPDSDVAGVVTISCGVAYTTGTGQAAVQDCLRRSDDAMYRAKAAGRNRVVTGIDSSLDAISDQVA